MGCRIAAAESDDGGLDGGGLDGSQWKGSGVEAGGWRVGWGPNLSQNVRVGFFPGRCLPGAREVRAGKAASPPSHFAQMASFGAQTNSPEWGWG